MVCLGAVGCYVALKNRRDSNMLALAVCRRAFTSVITNLPAMIGRTISHCKIAEKVGTGSPSSATASKAKSLENN